MAFVWAHSKLRLTFLTPWLEAPVVVVTKGLCVPRTCHLPIVVGMYGPQWGRRRYQAPAYGAYRARRYYRSPKGAAAQYAKTTKVTLQGPGSGGSITNQLRKIRTYIKKLAPEQKSVDVSCDVGNIDTSGEIAAVSSIAQGDTDSNRTGNSVNVTGIILNGILIRAADFTNGTVRNSYVRFLLVQDMQSGIDTIPTPADIVLSPAEPWNIVAPAQNSRFKILWTSQLFDLARIVPDSDDASHVPTQTPVFSANVSCNIKVDYNGANATDIEKNGLWFVVLSNNSVTTGDVECSARVIFTDV